MTLTMLLSDTYKSLFHRIITGLFCKQDINSGSRLVRATTQQVIKLMVFLVILTIGAMTPFHPVNAIAGDQINQTTTQIDVASIINLSSPGTQLSGGVSKAGTMLNPVGNIGFSISSRSKVPSSEWERYVMESSPQGQKGGILAGGVIAYFRFPL